MYHFVRTAMRAYEAPIDTGYYERGQNYQKRLDEFDRAKQAGWSMKVNLFDLEVVPRGTIPLKIVLEKDASKVASGVQTDDPGRVAATVTLSHRASIEGSRKYEFKKSDFLAAGNNRFELNREIENPLNGSVEVAVEVRPASDSAIYRSQTLLVK